MSTANFDFDSLPDEIILKIFGYLPFKDQVRQSGINRRFHQLSRTAIAQRKTLIVDENLMHYVIWNRPFGALLQECSPILEKIVCTEDEDYWAPVNLEPIFQFSYPNLVEIEIKRVFYYSKGSSFEAVDIDRSCMRMIEECPNLKRFTLDVKVAHPHCGSLTDFRFPYNVKSTNLENLDVYCCNDYSFKSMTGKVPNLKNLSVGCYCSDGGDILDSFFATTPVLEKITFGRTQEFDLETYFWRLPLKSLQLQFNYRYDQNVSDQLIKKISTSFPNLETLALADIVITDAGFRDICSLHALRSLDLSLKEGFQLESVEFLVKCVELEKFKLYGRSRGLSQPVDLSLPRNAFVTIIHSCQKLNTVLCDGVQELESIDAVIQILSSFANVKRQIKIGFGRKGEEIWKSDMVSTALQQLKENGGAEIEIVNGWDYMDEFME